MSRDAKKAPPFTKHRTLNFFFAQNRVLTRMVDLRWIGTLIVMFAGGMTALNLFPYSFIIGSIGSCILGVQCYFQKDWPIFWMNVWFAVMTLIAAVNYVLT